MSSTKMANSPAHTAQLSPLKRAYLALEETQIRLADLERARQEPIAIIGMSCRFPGGAHDPQAFWQLLRAGVDAVCEIPPARWDARAHYDPDPETQGKMYTQHGGFLQADVAKFDPQFFGVSPREAESMDPQQRLLLEVSWEALEHAGQARDRLAGRRTGVFIGITGGDYSQLLMASSDHSQVDTYHITGNTNNAAAGRLAYTFGFHGPCLAIDTACSSSLAALHQGCQSLRNDECDQALAGGVNLILSPIATIALSKARVLAPDGRCKAFAAAADGMGRAEGCGVLVLKRLSDAQADGDNILALIRGSAINQDGASSGLTVPNGPAQQAVIRSALQSARLSPDQISYVEAHGTGTALGDPIEMGALGAVFGPQRPPGGPLVVGSVKTNIGHAEAAAGIAGVIKTILALQHAEIPPHLHFAEPNALIQWDALPIVVPTERTPWPVGERPRRAGVSSFGFSGTNAHVILEEAPHVGSPQSEPAAARPLHLLALSARSAPALRELAERYALHLAANPALAIEVVCHTANTGRAHFDHRLTLVGATNLDVKQKLTAFADGQLLPGVRQRHAPATAPRVAFLFTGQGAQYPGMGREFYETAPVFRAALDCCAEILDPQLDIPLLEVLYQRASRATRHAPLSNTQYTQPALFALEYALAKLWQSWGVEPGAVLGHSVGELVAACVAGVFSLEDGLALIAARGRLMGALPTGGAMAAVFADATRVALVSEQAGTGVVIAALNAPQQVVISGEQTAVEAAMTALQSEGIACQRLQVSHAFHSPLMEPMLADFHRVAARVAYASPRVALISNLTGRLANANIAAPEYWKRHIREPVQFAEGMETLRQRGYEIFIEIGPKSTLLGLGRQCRLEDAVWLSSLQPEQSNWATSLDSFGALYVHGVPIDWAAFYQDRPRRHVVLPTYPFQRQRYWLGAADPHRAPSLQRRRAAEHALLGRRLAQAGSTEIRYEAEIEPDFPAFLADHRIFDQVVLPATAYLEMALAAGAAAFESESVSVADIVFEHALFLPLEPATVVQTLLSPAGESGYTFQIYSHPADDAAEPAAWTRHVSGQLTPLKAVAELPPKDLPTLRALITREVPIKTHYQQCAARGLVFGAAFQTLAQLWTNIGEALGRLRAPISSPTDNFITHPALLDGALQTLAAITLPAAPEIQAQLYLPVNLERLHLYRRPDTALWSHARLRPLVGLEPEGLTVDVHLYAADGSLVAAIEGLTLKRSAPGDFLPGPEVELQDWLYEQRWQLQPRRGWQPAPTYLSDPESVRDRLQPELVQLQAQPDLQAYWAALPDLEALSVAYVVAAIRELNGFEDLAGLEVEGKQTRLLERMLALLVEEDILRQRGDQWEVIAVPPPQDLSAWVADLQQRHPLAAMELTVLARCASQLVEVLRGRIDPLSLLFTGAGTVTAADLYQSTPGAQAANTLLAATVAATVERLPKHRRLRVLEIGAGTGGATAAILPQLPTDRTDYVFTDISAQFLHQAEDRFSAHPFVNYARLDIETDPAAQGFGVGEYDLVLAANVLHATRDLRETVQHVRQLLAPSGLLLCLEGTVPLRFIELTFGLTEGWQRFADTDLRPTHPLLPAVAWEKLLSECGFATATTLASPPGGEDVFSTQAVILAQMPETEGETPQPTPVHWLLFVDAGELGEQLAMRLRSEGDVCTLVSPAAAFQQTGAWRFTIDPTAPADFERLLRHLTANVQAPLHGAVDLWGISTSPTELLTTAALQTAIQMSCGSALHLVQAINQAKISPPPALWLVTRGAQSVAPADAVAAVWQSCLWGLGKSVALEHPELRCVRVDLDAAPDTEAAQILFEEIYAVTRDPLPPEDQVAFRAGRRYVARLARWRDSEPHPADATLRADRTYLITGGLHGLGLLTARWMVEHGARSLALLGRNPPDAAAQQQLQEMEQTGVEVLVLQADVSQPAEISSAFAKVEAALPPLAGIVHSAGVLADGVLVQQDWERFARVLAPKTAGAWNLHRLTRDKSIDFFILFSSAAALFGSPGQANHVAANAFLDALAHHRRAQGLPALSINWGAWSQVGAAAERQVGERVKLSGMGTIAPEQGLQLLTQLASATTTQIGVVPINWSVLLQQFSNGNTPHLLAEFVASAQAPAARPAASQHDLLRQLQAAEFAERGEILTIFLREQAAQVLRLPAAQLDVQQHLGVMGFDSLMAVDLRNRIKTALGVDVPMTKILEGISVADLVGFITPELVMYSAHAADDTAPETAAVADTEQAARLLQDLDKMSDSEAERLLADILSEEFPDE